MNSFKDCCDNTFSAQAGNDNFGGFGGNFGNSNLRRRRSFSFFKDQCQDVPPSGFRNIGLFSQTTGTMRGTIHANLNGDIVGKLTGKIDGLSKVLGCLCNVGDFGNLGTSFNFTVQFGDRAH